MLGVVYEDCPVQQGEQEVEDHEQHEVMPHQLEDGALPSQNQIPSAFESFRRVRVEIHINVVHHFAAPASVHFFCFIEISILNTFE